jgi:SAM-dependent methyltransferase
MIAFDRKAEGVIHLEDKEIYIFQIDGENIHNRTVQSFSEEWTKFNYFTKEEIKKAGDQYFDIIPSEYIRNKTILDVGCGIGRWSKYLADRAKFIECIDPSDAVYAAAKFLRSHSNIRVSKAGVQGIPFPDNSFDFVFSLGVLHHIPHTESAMHNCVRKVKHGGYFMVYLYYNFDNRGFLFKSLYKVSDFFRRIISRLPSKIKKGTCDVIAVLIYMPFVLITKTLRKVGLKRLAKKIPLSYYADHSFNIIRNDSLDRFGTPLEQRFAKKEIKEMMEKCGLSNVIFSDNEPYWHALGQKL